MSSLYILDINPFSDISFANFHGVGVDGFLCCAEAFWFDVVPLVYFCFCFLVCGDISRKKLLRLTSKSLLTIFSSRSFMVSGLAVRSLIHFKFPSAHGVRQWSSFILLPVVVQFSQQHLLRVLSHLYFLPPLSYIN